MKIDAKILYNATKYANNGMQETLRTFTLDENKKMWFESIAQFHRSIHNDCATIFLNITLY
uniref:Uncharacterized protein n=1 Tax=Romanomermis culicivorax TaxID=13658 RepID=A0A915IMS8_ROMCU